MMCMFRTAFAKRFNPIRQFHSMNLISGFISILLYSPMTFSANLTPFENFHEAHPGSMIEPLMSEALINYNTKKPKDALQYLERLLEVDHKNIDALELQALILKSQGQDRDALRSYLRLLKLKQGKERAPYHFEIGLIYFRAKKYDRMRRHLLRSAHYDFNYRTSHFFMGMADFQSKNYSRAEGHFEEVVGGGAPELEIASMFYLGVISLKNGFASLGISRLIEAKDYAEDYKENELVKGIYAAAKKALESFDENKFFGNVTLMGQYDSNVPRISDATTSPTDTTSFDYTTAKKSIKAIGMASVGYATSPIDPWQWLGSYRASYNYNFNRNAQGYEYFNQTLSNVFTSGALKRTTFGAKLDGNLSFQNIQSESNTSQYAYGIYTADGSVSPFFRQRFLKHFVAGLEVEGKYSKNFTDYSGVASTDATITSKINSKTTGWTASGKLNLSVELSSTFSPNLYGGYKYVVTEGIDQKARIIVVGVSNTARLIEKLRLTLSLDYSRSSYPERTSGSRTDNMYTARVNAYYSFQKWLAFLAGGGYTFNQSNIPDSYQYSQWDASIGTSLSF